MEIKTNRDLYQAISDLIEDPGLSSRALEDYLKALLSLAYEKHALPNFTAMQFLDVLTEAGSAEIPPFDERWRKNAEDEYKLHGFRRLEVTLIRQIVDLRELAESGRLDYEYRYFGIDSPRDNRWYNFDPGTFLECGAAGFFHRWTPKDKVTVITMDGSIEEHDSKEFDQPFYPIEQISWDDFAKFLALGQMYE